MDREKIIRQIMQIAAILGEDALLEVIEAQKKTAPGVQPEAVGAEEHPQG